MNPCGESPQIERHAEEPTCAPGRGAEGGRSLSRQERPSPSPEAVRQAQQADGLGSLLEQLGAPTRQAEYVANRLHPILASLICEVLRAMPLDPGSFCVRWLLKHLHAPESVVMPLLEWLDERDQSSLHNVPLNGAETRPASILKTSARSDTSAASRTGSRKPSSNLSVEIRGRSSPGGGEHEGLADQIGSSSASSSAKLARAKVRRQSTVRLLKPQVTNVVELIKDVPHFRHLDDDERRLVAEACVVRRYDAHAEVVKYGDVTSELFLVVDGDCCVSVPQLQKILKPGDLFNDEVFSAGKGCANAMLAAAPTTDVTLLSVSMKDLEALGLQKKVMKKMTKASEDSRIVPAKSVVDSELTFVDSAKEVPKTPQETEFIKMAVRRNQLTDMLQLSEEQLESMAFKMVLRSVTAGEVIVTKGGKGDKFFVVHEGCFETDETPNRLLHSGDSFGELSLLYGTQPKASVVAARSGALWVLELVHWRDILSSLQNSRVGVYQGLLSGIPEICSAVPQLEKRARIADCLEEVYYRAGEQVVVEDTVGYVLHILLEGSCVATRKGEQVSQLTKGSYFGEASFFSGLPYVDTVEVSSDNATILQFDRDTCRMLGLHIQFSDATEGDCTPRVMARRRRSLLTLAATQIAEPSEERLTQKRAQFPREKLKTLGVLGSGSFAQVSLQLDEATGQLFALKAMPKAAIVANNLKAMVLGERLALAEMGVSQFVVPLITTYRDDRCIYFLMEPALGGELFDLYQEHDKWLGQEKYAAFFGICTALGLEHIHSKRLVHRDVKLENILVDSEGYARITDMGLAKVVVGRTYTVCGTADYLAPETLKQAGHNRAVDWWALGILLFAMMSGRMPFDAGDVMQTYKNIVKGFRKDHFPATFTTDLIDLIKGLCRKKPQERLPMLPGGVEENLAGHAWFHDGTLPRWQAIKRRAYPPPFKPPQLSVEERAMRLKAPGKEINIPEYTDDGSGWDLVF